MRLPHALAVLVVLALAVGAWLLASSGPRGATGALAQPTDGAKHERAPDRPTVALVAGGGASGSPAASDASAERADVAEARPTRAARAAPAESPGPQIEAPPATPSPAPPSVVIFTLRVHVRAERGGASSAGAEALVIARCDGLPEAVTGAARLFQTVELEVARPAGQPIPSSCVVLVDHPDFAPQTCAVDLQRALVVGRDARGRQRVSAQLTVVLERHAAVLVGRTRGTELVALAPYSAAREPETLALVHLADASDGDYALRVPRPGEWVVIALREGAHPSYVIVEVPPRAHPGDAGASAPTLQVPRELAPLETVLSVRAISPFGYDPSGIELELVPTDPRAAVLGSDGALAGVRLSRADAQSAGFVGGPPFLTWHHTYADPPSGAAWGYDLRAGRDEPERRDSIARVSLRGTLDGTGSAQLLGGATGATALRVKHPFSGQWLTEPLREVASIDQAPVALPVARLDVLGMGPAGPLAGGVARVAPPVESGARAEQRGRFAAPPIPAIGTTLDALGAGRLFVPSSTVLVLEVHDAGHACAATRRLTTPSPGSTAALTLTATELEPTRAPAREAR